MEDMNMEKYKFMKETDCGTNCRATITRLV